MRALLVFTLIFSNQIFAQAVPVYNYDQSSSYPNTSFPGAGFGNGYGGLGLGGGIGGINPGPGMNGGGYPGASGMPTYTSGNASIGMYDSNSRNYNVVRPSANCPLLTTTAKEDQDVFADLQNYFRSFSQRPECSQLNLNAMSGVQTTSQLEQMLNLNSSNGSKCYSKNVQQISDRNMALYYADKGMDMSMNSPYYSCSASSLSMTLSSSSSFSMTSTGKVTKDMITNCIAEKYQSIVEENTVICKEVVAPQLIQDQVNKGMVELERLLVQTLSQTGPCAPKTQDTFKMAMNTFLKVKSLSAVGPWGAAAGFGADMIGSLLDKFFPSDAQKASALMDDILSEDNYEQNACLYFNIQQKMYCSDQPVIVTVPNPGCNKINVSNDLIKLLENVRDLKKVTDAASPVSPGLYSTGSYPGVSLQPGSNPGGYWQPGGASGVSGAASGIDTTKLEGSIDDITKYAKASEFDIRNRIKTLPKIQQAKELEKINRFYSLLDQYQNFDPNNTSMIQQGQAALDGLYPLLLSSDPTQKINFEELILKTTSGLKMDSIKQRGIASSIESLLAREGSTYSTDEKSRSMAKYNKYKNAMAEMAQSQFKNRLEKQFNEFKKQVTFISKQENGVVNDLVSEGLLRNIVRHCTLMQEIYDPKLDGSMPDQCAKLNCGKENRLNWLIPKEGQANFTIYKNSFCDKNFSYKKIEDDFVNELKDKNGGKICGKKVSDFFSSSFF